MRTPTFAAIDFETASRDPGSAISVGVVRVEYGEVVGEHETLIRPPPGTSFDFVSLHGIGPETVARARPFAAVWRSVRPLVEELAREVWGIFPTRLPDVCRELGIPLRHHRALSDACACAEVVLRAWLTTRGMNTILRACRR